MIVCGLFSALSVKVILPDADPFAAGVNVTTRVHFAPDVSVALALHVLADVSAKTLLLLAAEVIVVVVRPVLVTVTVFVALVVPFFTVPKLRLDGLGDASGSITAAVIVTVCGEDEALSTIVRIADCTTFTAVFGTKLISIWQLFPAASVFEHRFSPTKS